MRRVWETLGRDDPLWAVLSRPDKRGGRWDAAEFLATGILEIDSQMAALAPTGWPAGRELALDFGCGAGRLSRGLAAHFRRVIGLDVSAGMVAAARELNAELAQVEFRQNTGPTLAGVADASVDCVFSHITLQHIPPELALGYVEEFFRVLAPGGVAVFQFVAGHDRSPRGALYRLLSNRGLNPLRRLAWRRREVFEMHVLGEERLHGLLARWPALRLLATRDDGAAGPGWVGRRWTVVNEAPVPLRVEHGGLVLHVDARDAHIGAPLASGQRHEPQVEAVLRERLRGGDTFLDIGANLGIFSLLGASLVGASGRVIAVEPVAANRVLLARSAQANGFGNIELVAAAAADRPGVIQLATHATTSNAALPAAAGPRLSLPDATLVEVASLRLDDALGGLDRLDLVKLDVAGMEPAALRGMEGLLGRFRPPLLCEFHPQAMQRATGIDAAAHLAWLSRFHAGFTVLHRDGRREHCTTPAAVLEAWRQANAASGMDGTLHLDLLCEPR